jgi:hypothetical protein
MFFYFVVFIFLIKNKQINRLNMLNMSVVNRKKILFYFKNSYNSEEKKT